MEFPLLGTHHLSQSFTLVVLVTNKLPKTGILNLLEPGDDLMADKGFDIEDEMPQGVNLNIPPFLKDQELSVQAENETRKIAAVRVHVERAIQRIKCFRILKNVFPLSMASELNKVRVICSYLTLFQPPMISNDIEHK